MKKALNQYLFALSFLKHSPNLVLKEYSLKVFKIYLLYDLLVFETTQILNYGILVTFKKVKPVCSLCRVSKFRHRKNNESVFLKIYISISIRDIVVLKIFILDIFNNVYEFWRLCRVSKFLYSFFQTLLRIYLRNITYNLKIFRLFSGFLQIYENILSVLCPLATNFRK